MIKRIILLGDSFTFGHGCSDKNYYFDIEKKVWVGSMASDFHLKPSNYCWGSLLQNNINNALVINASKPGHSYSGMFRDLMTLHASSNINSDYLIVAAGAFMDRIEVASYLNPEDPVTWSIKFDGSFYRDNDPKDYSTAKMMYAKYLYNDSIGLQNAFTSIMGIYGVAKACNAQFAWSMPLVGVDYSKLKYKISKLVPNYFPHIFRYDFSGRENEEFNKTCYQPDGHCNDTGHKIYFDRVIMPFMKQLGIS